MDFIKSNLIVAKWTLWYFFGLWLILRFIFKFDMFSAYYWWKFFHATLHGFGGFVFGLLIYTAIPIYIATTAIVYRKKELVITIPFIDKLINFIRNLWPQKQSNENSEPVPDTPEPTTENTGPEYPSDLPPELRIPYERAKQHMSLTGAVSVYNKTPEPKTQPTTKEDISVPIPNDFDLSDSDDFNESSIPTFTEINFDPEPEPKNETLENNTTKYLQSKNIEFETYKEFVATEKYVIYEHNDEDFWIMDNEIWFAAGQQKDSPINELIELGTQNELQPVLYLHTKNIMDLDDTIKNFESKGIRVITDLNQLD